MSGITFGGTVFSSKKIYSRNFSSITPPKAFDWIWSSMVCKKIKVFIWLLFRDRINSRNILRRKNFDLDNDDFSCVLCDQGIEETTYHLIFECPFSTRCWDYLHLYWDHSLNFFAMMHAAKHQSDIQFFMEIFVVASWEIWKQRNGKIFRQSSPSFDNWKRNFKDTILLQMYRMKEDLRSEIALWLDSL